MKSKVYPFKVTCITVSELKLWTGTDFPRLKQNRNARPEKLADTEYLDILPCLKRRANYSIK